MDNSFLFQLPSDFLSGSPEDAVIKFRIMDKVMIGDDQIISTTELPLASLQGQVVLHQ